MISCIRPEVRLPLDQLVLRSDCCKKCTMFKPELKTGFILKPKPRPSPKSQARTRPEPEIYFWSAI